MKKFAFLILFTFLGTLSSSVLCQTKTPDPFILSIMPDSLFAKYEYSQIVFVTASIGSTFGKDPTLAAINDLKKQIIALCQLNKFDGFILNQMIFAKPFDEGKLVCYGTMIRKKAAK